MEKRIEISKEKIDEAKNEAMCSRAFLRFVSFLPDGDYRVVEPRDGAYDLRCDGVLITVLNGEIKHLYIDAYCGDNLRGYMYRMHRDGREIGKLPKRFEKSIDVSEQWREIEKEWRLPLDWSLI